MKLKARRIRYFLKWQNTLTGTEGRGRGIEALVSDRLERVKAYNELEKIAQREIKAYPHIDYSIETEFFDN